MENKISKKFALGLTAGVLALTTAVYVPSANTYAADSLCAGGTALVNAEVDGSAPFATVKITEGGAYTLDDTVTQTVYIETDEAVTICSSNNTRSAVYANVDNAKLTLSGSFVRGLGASSHESEITLVDGTYSGSIGAYDSSKVIVKGGDFTNNVTFATHHPITNTDGSIVLEGGIFASDVTAAAGVSLASGYNINEANGVFVVEANKEESDIVVTPANGETKTGAELEISASIADSETGFQFTVDNASEIENDKVTIVDGNDGKSATIKADKSGTLTLKVETTFKNSDDKKVSTTVEVEVYDKLEASDVNTTGAISAFGGGTITLDDLEEKLEINDAKTYKSLTVAIADIEDQDENFAEYFRLEDDTITVKDEDYGWFGDFIMMPGYNIPAIRLVVKDGFNNSVDDVYVPVVIETTYEFTEESQDQTWDKTENADEPLVFTIDKDSAFSGYDGYVYVWKAGADEDEEFTPDDYLLDNTNFKASRGSLVIELDPDYLASLENGEYTLATALGGIIPVLANFTVAGEVPTEDPVVEPSDDNGSTNNGTTDNGSTTNNGNTSNGTKVVPGMGIADDEEEETVIASSTSSSSATKSSSSKVSSPNTGLGFAEDLETRAKTIAMTPKETSDRNPAAIVLAISAAVAALGAVMLGLKKKATRK